MKAYNNSEEIKQKYVNRMIGHIEADRLERGATGENNRGCAVACTLDMKYDHKLYEEEIGPEWLARLEDTLFEGMSLEKSKTWPLIFLQAINVGSDLDKIQTPYKIYLLEENLKTLNSLKVDEEFKSVDEVIQLSKVANIQMIDALKSGDDAAKSAAKHAARSAEYAASSAAKHAARSAEYAAMYVAMSVDYATRSAAMSAARSAEYVAMSADYAARYESISAEYATRSAAMSADYAAMSADYAARYESISAEYEAAFDKHADKLIELIRECKCDVE